MLKMKIILAVFAQSIAIVSALTARPQQVRYQELFRICELTGDNVEITEPFSALRGWAARFEKRADELFVGLTRWRDDDIMQAVIQEVQATVRAEGTDHKFGNDPYPHMNMISKNLLDSYGAWIKIPADQDCMDVDVGVIFKDWDKQVNTMNQFHESHPDSIGFLSDKDLREMEDFRQTDMEFYSDPETLVQISKVDLHAMAQLSHFMRGLLRFNRNSQQEITCPESQKMICKHFNQETVGDLIDITHGRLFKRSDFLSKSIDYLIQMAYISQQFQITSLKIMMDHCIYIKTVWDQMSGYHIDTLTKGLKYTIKTQNGKLLRLFWKIIHLIDFDRDSNEYQQIRKVFEDHDPLLLAVFDAKDDE